MGLPDNCIPEAELPQWWSDDVRMNALFAPFRLKSANPESWDMKMKFWSDMLRIWCKCKKDPLVSASDAKVAFQRKGRTPACIEIVVEEMFRNGELSPLSKYQQILHNGPEGWMRWGTRLAFKPAALALTAVASLLPARQAIDSDGLPKASIDSTMRFVLESAVKEQATDLLANYPPGAERIGTVEELMRRCGWQLSRDTFEVLLGYLVSQGAAVKKGDVVKLAEPNKRASPVTESDEATVKLLSAEARLSRDAARLARDVAAAEADARAALQLGNRVAAKNHLRRKHQLSARVAKCEGALENVQHLLVQMKEMDVNTAIVDTYKTTSQAMKRNMTEGGLDEDRVHDTMDDLREVMESINEVEKALAGPAEDLDQAELEQELRELLEGGDGAGGGTPLKDKHTVLLPSPPREPPARADREFVFDGEARVLAELNELGIDDAGAKDLRTRVASPRGKVKADDGWDVKAVKPEPLRPSKAWYPPSQQCLKPDEAWNNNLDTSFELRLDERLHPGQRLNVDFTSPPRHYNTDFIVSDHKMADGVWLYNSRDDNSNIASRNTHIAPTDSPTTKNSQTVRNSHITPKNSHITPGNSNVTPGNSNVAPRDSHVTPENSRVASTNRNDMESRHIDSRNDYIGSTNSHAMSTNSHIGIDNRSLPSRHRNLSTDNSVDYLSPESPGKSPGSFQMAPGGERKHSHAWLPDETPIDDLEARLRNLRGFNL